MNTPTQEVEAVVHRLREQMADLRPTAEYLHKRFELAMADQNPHSQNGRLQVIALLAIQALEGKPC